MLSFMKAFLGVEKIQRTFLLIGTIKFFFGDDLSKILRAELTELIKRLQLAIYIILAARQSKA